MQSNSQPSCDAIKEKGQFARSLPMGLCGGPISSGANAFVDELASLIPTKARPSSVQKVRTGVGALMADLFDLHRSRGSDPTPTPGAHGMATVDFPSKDLGFGRSIFKTVTVALSEAGYLEVALGKPNWRSDFGVWFSWKGQITTFTLTAKAVAEAAKHGVQVDDWIHHWTESTSVVSAVRPEQDMIVLKETKRSALGKKDDAKRLPIPKGCPIARRLQNQMEVLNKGIFSHQITGTSFAGLMRIFNNGDVDGYGWDKGGRFYSLPGCRPYEQLPYAHRLERIRLNGQQVCEVDIRASHLTILHALLDEPMAAHQDPYEIEGIERDVAKQWCTHALGLGKADARRWGDNAKAAYSAAHEGRVLQKDFPMAQVGRAVMAKHRVFERLQGSGLQSVDLQFHESEVLRLAMMDLLASNIPVLPMHDALIVPEEAQQVASEALRRAYVAHMTKATGKAPQASLRTSVKD